jgi:hypothetical protein
MEYPEGSLIFDAVTFAALRQQLNRFIVQNVLHALLRIVVAFAPDAVRDANVDGYFRAARSLALKHFSDMHALHLPYE